MSDTSEASETNSQAHEVSHSQEQAMEASFPSIQDQVSKIQQALDNSLEAFLDQFTEDQ